MRTPRGVAARVAIVYAVAAAVWILVSSGIAFGFPQPLEGYFETGKGLLFVLVTSVVLYWVISRWTLALEAQVHQTDEARRRLQQVVDTVPFGVILLDGANTISFANLAAERLLGCVSAECIGQPFEFFCKGDRSADIPVTVGELLRAGSVAGMEVRIDRPVSNAVVMHAAEIDPDNPGTGWVVAIADNTSARERSLKSESLLNGYRSLCEMTIAAAHSQEPSQLLEELCEMAVADGGFAGAWAVVRDEGGQYVDAGMVGLPESAADVMRFMREHADDAGQDTVASMLAGEIVVDNDLAHDEKSRWYDIAREAGLGSYVSFGAPENGVLRASTALFAREPGFFDAEELRLVETMRNGLALALDRLVLDGRRLEAEQALERSENYYRQLFDCNPHPMWVYDPVTMGFLEVNDATIKKYGYSRDEFSAMTIMDLRPPSEVAQLLDFISRKDRGFQDAGFWTHMDAQGREFPVHVMTHDIEWAGREAELVMIEEVARMA